MEGNLSKMKVKNGEPIQYYLIIDNKEILMNLYIGKQISITYLNQINCCDCGSKTKKSFQGFCYNCFTTSPMASPCIIKPELCKAHLGEGRNVEWEQKHHNQPHIVYLAATDKVKVGITRDTQIPTRWIDQGANKTIILAKTYNRYQAGILEVALKEKYSDKTNWRSMLKNIQDKSIDLEEEKWNTEEILPSDLSQFITDDDEIHTFNYPVLSYPNKISSIGFDKTPVIKKILKGMKGQYLIFEDNTVLNIRKHIGYKINFKI